MPDQVRHDEDGARWLQRIVNRSSPRPRRLHVPLRDESLAAVDAFLVRFAADRKAGEEMTHRLRAVGEETVHSLRYIGAERRLLLVARADGKAMELEFVAGASESNLEDLLAVIDVADLPHESAASLRLLKHHASSVGHRQYHDIDVVTVRVE